MERAAALGVKAIVNPGFLHQWGDMYLHGWRGDDTAYEELRIIPIRSMLDAGVTVAAGSDYPCAPMSPLMCVQAAVTRGTMTGEVVDEREGIDPLAALRLYTSSAAVVDGRDDIGVLEVGRRANLAVLEDDPTNVGLAAIGGIRVLETWVDGERVHAAGPPGASAR